VSQRWIIYAAVVVAVIIAVAFVWRVVSDLTA